MRIALAQINTTVGDLVGNSALILWYLDRAREAGADLCVFPELAISGYPPRDLLLQEGFVEACVDAGKKVGREGSHGITVVFGLPLPADPERPELGVANSLVVWKDRRYIDFYDKRLLPSYDVFDEDRYFEPGDRAAVLDVKGVKVGLSVCEDLWQGEDAGFSARYLSQPEPVQELVEQGAELVVCPSASPFVIGKGERHRDILSRHASNHGVYVAAVNQVGGNDDLVFDGHASVHAPDGALIAAAKGFGEDLIVCDIDPAKTRPGIVRRASAVEPTKLVSSTNRATAEQLTAETTLVSVPRFEPIADPVRTTAPEKLLFDALMIGVEDYLRKTGFEKATIGLSGGIDSAVTAVIAARALGPENVLGVSMPGKYSSEHSKSDASDLAERLGIDFTTIPIEQPFAGFRTALDKGLASIDQPPLGVTLPDIAEENLQSRLRGTTLMTLSNRTGALVLATGNKSEMAVGYCTLYGDMNGGLSVLSDVGKTWVYRLAEWINENPTEAGFEARSEGPANDRGPIPRSTIAKPPSAELAPDQEDSDSLPPYELLDEIIERYVELQQSQDTILDEIGLDVEAEEVLRVLSLIDRNEYKRRQAAPGLKVTSVAFGAGRRRPLAQKWRT